MASDAKPRELAAITNRLRVLERKLGITVEADTLTTGDLTATTGTVRLGASTFITGLPSSDPHVVGQLYTATAAVKVSAG